MRWLALAVGAWIVCLIVFLGIVPAVWQSLFVNPNQLAKETPYIARNIDRHALGLRPDGHLARRPTRSKATSRPRPCQANEVTVRNIRLWDPEVLLAQLRQLQELRPYYSVHHGERRSLSG